MRSICENVLKTQQRDASLRLSEVIVNLNLLPGPFDALPPKHAVHCTYFFSKQSYQPGEKSLIDLRNQARILARQMAGPKVVRILTHVRPSYEMRAFDALTGENLGLGCNAEWDADGEPIKDEG